jgi:hypothetical protein
LAIDPIIELVNKGLPKVRESMPVAEGSDETVFWLEYDFEETVQSSQFIQLQRILHQHHMLCRRKRATSFTCKEILEQYN